MKKLIKLLVVLVIIGVIIKFVGAMVMKKKLATMSDEEIRGFLASKLDGKVSPEQLASIQDAVIAGVRGAEAGSPDVPEDIEELVEDAAEEVVEEAEEAEATAEAAGDKAAELVEALEEAVED